MESKRVIKNLVNCARCGGTHKDLEFSLLERPCEHQQYWAMCPTNNEPIMMWVEVEEK